MQTLSYKLYIRKKICFWISGRGGNEKTNNDGAKGQWSMQTSMSQKDMRFISEDNHFTRLFSW